MRRFFVILVCLSLGLLTGSLARLIYDNMVLQDKINKAYRADIQRQKETVQGFDSPKEAADVALGYANLFGTFDIGDPINEIVISNDNIKNLDSECIRSINVKKVRFPAYEAKDAEHGKLVGEVDVEKVGDKWHFSSFGEPSATLKNAIARRNVGDPYVIFNIQDGPQSKEKGQLNILNIQAFNLTFTSFTYKKYIRLFPNQNELEFEVDKPCEAKDLWKKLQEELPKIDFNVPG